MIKGKGLISITRTSAGGTGDNLMKVRIMDDASGSLVAEASIKMEEFAYAVTGQSFQKCTFQLNTSGSVGKKQERKIETLVFAEHNPTHDQITEAAIEYEEDGWKFDGPGSIQQGDRQRRGKDTLLNARYTRYVERKDDEPKANQG